MEGRILATLTTLLAVVAGLAAPQSKPNWSVVSSPPPPFHNESASLVKEPPLKSSRQSDPRCPELQAGSMSSLTQEEFISQLTDSCRYDKLAKPDTTLGRPLVVEVQLDLTHIEAEQLRFQCHMVVQYGYTDPRLSYAELSPGRSTIVGQDLLRGKVWTPHVIINNERAASIMGSDGRDVFLSISPHGRVTYSYRMTATFYCWMNLQKFPFDTQLCSIQWSSWAYNTSSLRLTWKPKQPVLIAPNLHLTEFVITDSWTEEVDLPAPLTNGGFDGEISSLIFKYRLKREVGFYILDFFLPSILLVMISWVTFWLQADAAPPRVTLGTSTMLAFITLSGSLTRNLPKVSYIKASEVWFIGCACFIFLSMAEFAFVNVIWRRTKKIQVRKQTSKYILQGALTPSLVRRQMQKAESEGSLYRAASSSSLDVPGQRQVGQSKSGNIPTITTTSSSGQEDKSGSSTPAPEHQTWTAMTPQEIAKWIDKQGNYSSVLLKFRITRQVGFYLLDYFLPSVLLVITSWVTFWLQADATPPRATIGTSTMLAFVTLSGNLSRNLPKVSYIKASEIWFLGCATFIFASLAEFAFVNVIWRRKKKVELLKPTPKHILKGALTPSLARRQLSKKADSLNSIYKASSCSNLSSTAQQQVSQNNYLTVHSFPTLSLSSVPTIHCPNSQEDLVKEDSSATIPMEDAPRQQQPAATTFMTMTPQEVAIWIDKRSRVAFPVAFIIFNILYWSFVYAI